MTFEKVRIVYDSSGRRHFAKLMLDEFKFIIMTIEKLEESNKINEKLKEVQRNLDLLRKANTNEFGRIKIAVFPDSGEAKYIMDIFSGSTYSDEYIMKAIIKNMEDEEWRLIDEFQKI